MDSSFQTLPDQPPMEMEHTGTATAASTPLSTMVIYEDGYDVDMDVCMCIRCDECNGYVHEYNLCNHLWVCCCTCNDGIEHPMPQCGHCMHLDGQVYYHAPYGEYLRALNQYQVLFHTSSPEIESLIQTMRIHSCKWILHDWEQDGRGISKCK